MNQQNNKKHKSYPYNFGRLFFPNDCNFQKIPDKILFQPLGNHVGNVMRLVKYWYKKDNNDLFDDCEVEKSFLRVMEGAKIHDMAKPQTFKIRVDTTKQSDKQEGGKFKKYIYSFSGHRFSAKHPNKWIEKLAQGHHDFTTDCITRDTYELNKIIEFQDILETEHLTYAQELYILEMCDQIEADLACRVLEDLTHAEERTFMEYNIYQDENDKYIYNIDPFPFQKEEISLTFRSWLFTLTEENKQELQIIIDKNEDNESGNKKLAKKLDDIVKKWWQDLRQKNQLPIDEKPKTITIKSHQLETEELDKKDINKDCDYWYQKLTAFKTPNPMQKDVFEAISSSDNISTVLKASTGVGKLEAILIPSLANNYRLILPLPARSLLEDHQSRVEKYLIKYSQLFPEKELSLVIDTGSKMTRYVYQNGETIISRASNISRHLYKGNVILTTLDKFIYRYFGYGDNQKSFIYPLRINDNSNKTLICFDEAHSYDKISFTNFSKLVQALYEAGRNIVLMTATLPHKYLEEFDYLKDNLIDYIDEFENIDKLESFQDNFLKQPYQNQKQLFYLDSIQYPRLLEDELDNEERKKILEEKTDNFINSITKKVLDEWRSSDNNNRIITVVESVKDAVDIYKQLKEELAINNNEKEKFLFLYHGRISNTPHHKEDKNNREAIYQQIKKRNDNERSYIIITTRAIEVGCDLNAQVLVTQLCPPENLIQRAGRCNRKGNITNAKIIVVGDNIPDFVNTLSEPELERYKQKLKSHHDKNFEAKEIMECVSDTPQIDDFRIVELFSQLHDYVYEGDLTFKPIYEKGLVITRSWIPSVTLVYDNGENGDDINKMPQITVPVDRLILKKDKETKEYKNQYSNVINVYERYYNKENYQWKDTDSLRWGCAYKKNIIVKINKSHDGADCFDGKPYNHYEYNPELGFVDLPGIFVRWKVKDFEQPLGYTEGDKTIAIKYITPFDT